MAASALISAPSSSDLAATSFSTPAGPARFGDNHCHGHHRLNHAVARLRPVQRGLAERGASSVCSGIMMTIEHVATNCFVLICLVLTGIYEDLFRWTRRRCCCASRTWNWAIPRRSSPASDGDKRPRLS